MNLRLKKLLTKLSAAKIDGLLVSKDSNVSYLAGFESSESWLLVSPKRCVYITDFRYEEQVRNQLSREISLSRYKRSIYKTINQLCRWLEIRHLGFEANSLSFEQYQKLRAVFSRRLKPTTSLVGDLRQIKEPQEIQKIRKAIALTAEAFNFLKKQIKPGKSEEEIAISLEVFVRKKGARLAFPPIIASGINSVFPHAQISPKIIAANEPVTVDIGIDSDGYKSDLTRVFFLGKIPLFYKKIYRLALKAQERAIKGISAGQPARRIDGLARNFIKQKGLGKFFGHSLGHGLGLEVHEGPRISSQSKIRLKAGMVITIEPGIYLPGKFGVRVEDMVLVKEKGREVLSGFIHKSN